jgi:hypothetical protein
MIPDFNDRVAWINDEAGFAKQLARGRKTQIRIAMRLLPLGHWVRMGPLAERKSAKRDGTLDDADLEISGGHLLEVKGRNLAFTCVEDYPYETIFVCAKRRWDNRSGKPCAIIIVSEITDAAIVIPSSSRRLWTETTTHDRVRDIDFTALCAPRNSVATWDQLLEHLRTKEHLPNAPFPVIHHEEIVPPKPPEQMFFGY